MLYAWVNLILGLLTSVAMAGAWFGHRTLVAVVALAASGLWLYQPLGDLLYRAVGPVLALAVLAILAFVGERLPRSWLWLAGVWYLGFALLYFFRPVGGIEFLAVWVLLGTVAGVIGWSVIDARLLLATALAIGFFYSFAVFRFYVSGLGGGRGIPWDLWPWFVPAAVGLALAALAAWRLRRQAVL